jgi:hypothetical protein
MTVMLLPPKKWTRFHKWMWATVVVIGLIVALVDGLSR